jgi:hypothetical protein
MMKQFKFSENEIYSYIFIERTYIYTTDFTKFVAS